MSRTKLFVSYSHIDQAWRERLTTHLAVLEGRGLVDVWADTRIGIGAEWRTDLDMELQSCQVAVLLVSANFLASRFIQEVEVKALLERHETQGLVLLPVIARPCAWRLVDWLGTRQCRPSGGRALSSGAEPDVDHDLAMLTYEIGSLLRQGGAAARDEMARLTSQQAQKAERTDPRSDAPVAAISGFVAGRSWRGHYASVSGDAGRPMVLSLDSVDGVRCFGRVQWPNQNAVTLVEGHIETYTSTDAGEGVWAQVAQRAQQPRCAIRFTDVAQEGGRPLELGGDYRAILQADMALVGLWYPQTTASAPIGQFYLRRDARA